MKKTILLIFLLLFAVNGNAQCWKVISTGYQNTLAIKQDGTLWAWGRDFLTGGAGDVSTPVQIGTGTNWKAVSAGSIHALAIKTDGTLWAWGLSSDGSFGSGIAGDFSILPKQIGMQSDWLTIAAGTKVSTAIKTDGTLWSWGYNAVGQVGDGTTVTKLIPTQIGTDTNWSSISLHVSNYTYSSTLALKTDGTLWAWGTNNDGQLGDGTFVQKNAPVQIGTDTNWSSIDTGESHSLAIKTNGTLWAWGKNQYGELGDGTTVKKNVPTQIGTSTLWTSVRGGTGFSVGTQTGGLLLAWGVNSSGQLGNGTLTIQTTPLLSTTSAQTVSVGSSHSFIQNATGTYSWGYNAYGVLGDGTTANKNIPTLINCPTSRPQAIAQTYCSSATVANLVATGTALQWYANATLGTALAGAAPLATGTYYVSQTENGFESLRTAVAVTVSTTPPPTAPTSAAQTFCSGATIANLTATGTTLQWYTSLVEKTALPTTTALATGTYFVSELLNGCESTRTAVSVTINTTPVPAVAAQAFCVSGTVANLVATGTDLQWYSNPTGGTVLAGTTVLATGTYYVSQTLNDCESARTAVAVTINTTPAPTVAAQTFCNSGTIASLTFTETIGATIQWYSTSRSTTPLVATTALSTGTYYVSQTISGCESARIAVSVTINSTPASTAAAQTFCNSGTVANLVATGITIKWYMNPTGGTALSTTTALITRTYYTTQTLNGCESSRTAVTVTITSTPAITYTTPNTYSVGTIISPLTPVNTGCPIPISKVSTFAGSGAIGATDGTAASASFYRPSGVTVDATGNIYVADTYNQKIRKITPAGVVSTFAGNGSAGATDGPAATASFYGPSGITIDATGNIYVADIGSRKIRKITPTGIVSTIAGSGLAGSNDGLAANASFYGCSGVTVDDTGNIYVADSFNNKIRKITPAGVVSTFAGDGSTGATDGPAATASFSDPSGVTIDGTGIIYVADSGNTKIRKITPAGVVSTVAGSGVLGYTNGPAATAGFNQPSGVAIDAKGNIYVADHFNQSIRKITPAGIVSTVAGNNGVPGSTDGSLAIASFYFPKGVALDSSGNIYVADRQNNKIRKITLTGYEILPNLPAGLSFDSTTGIISGTPTGTSPATNYVITAHTMGGTTNSTVNISVGTLSTSSFVVKNNLKIYPNPTTNNVTIELNNLNNANLQVSDINGRILLNQKLDNTTVIDVSGFPSATYLFKVNSDQGTLTSKVIKK
ncbi:T9SS type A sorting domain-containing protein [Flavobacterium sp. XS1P32]|uniref:Ig-like domain-containing protein n=1 Tax=Flavobacterium sp. XS1P32 TaxID=3401726 RepID=UPI003AAC4CE9